MPANNPDAKTVPRPWHIEQDFEPCVQRMGNFFLTISITMEIYYYLGIALSLSGGIIALDASFRRKRRKEIWRNQYDSAMQKIYQSPHYLSMRHPHEPPVQSSPEMAKAKRIPNRPDPSPTRRNPNWEPTETRPLESSERPYEPFTPDTQADYTTWSDNNASNANSDNSNDNNFEFGGGDTAGGGAGGDY